MRDKEKDAAEKAIRQQHAMETAFHLFAENGIDQVTMPDIAKESGVGRPSLYRYFSSKVDLVIAIGTSKWEEYIASHNATITQEERSRMTGAETLRWYMDAFLDLYRNHSNFLRFNYYFNSYLRREGPTQEQMAGFLRLVDGLGADFHELYQKGMADGTLRSDIPEDFMFSSTFHIMLAAVTRYAVGLVYKGTNPDSELVLLDNALLREYINAL